jgi:uncharacterized protein
MNEKERIVACLERKPQVLFAYLFGSRVKGYAKDGSDWDVAVCLDSPDKTDDGWPIFDLEAELSREAGTNVQVTDLNQALTPLLGFGIVSDGEELINKDEAKHLEIVSRLLRQYFDWTFFQDRHLTAAKLKRE